MMTMAIPVPKQSKPKPFVDPLRVKPKKGSVKCDVKDPRFRFCYIVNYLKFNTGEREAIVEAMEDVQHDNMLVDLGKLVNNYTIHHTMIEVVHQGIIVAMLKFWKEKSIDPVSWADQNILDVDDFYIKRGLPWEAGGATYIIDLFKKCFEEAVTFELKGVYKYSGQTWALNGTLNPTLNPTMT